MSQEILHIVVNSVDNFDVSQSCVDECNKCLELETGLLKNKDLIEKDVYDKLDNSGENQNAPTFNQVFEINELKTQSQEKDTVIRKLKDRIKSLSGKDSVENVKKDIDEIEIINIELKHSVAKLLSENENLRKKRDHLKSMFKDQFDSIKKTHVRSKEHSDSLIAQINAKKNVVDTAISTPIATTIAPGMFKLYIKPISHRLKNNTDAHEDYLKKIIENTDTICGLVEHARKHNPSEPLLDSACRFTKHVQELFADSSTSSSNSKKQIDSHITQDSNKPLLHSTGVKCSTSISGSKPSGNTKNNRISQSSSSNKTNKVEDQCKNIKSKKKKKNHVVKAECNAHVMQSMLNANSKSVCAICNECLFDANHAKCVLAYVHDVNVLSKSENAKLITPTSELKVYSRRPKASRSVGSSSKSKIVVQIVLWYLDSGCSKHMIGNRSQLINFVSKFLGTARFGNDHIAKIMGYGDYQRGNVIIS
ncbi:hypothetical protein Tco_0635686 [Tanacetum coccineum]